MSDSQLKTIETLHRLIGQPARTAALNTALRLGVIDALRDGQKTAGELAAACRIRSDAVPALMELLQPAGLVEQFGEHYALSQAARMTPPNLWAMLFDQWTALEKTLRDESDALSEFDRLKHEERSRSRFRAMRAMIEWAETGAALKVAEALDIGGLRRSLHILDLGCGSAVYSMTLAHRDPGCLVKLVDRAEGLERARATVDSLEIQSRVTLTEADDLNIPGHDGGFDLVIISDQIHTMPSEEQDQLLRTAHRVLGPDGEVAVIDVFAGQERGREVVSRFQLELLVGTGLTMVTPDRLNAKMSGIGFSEIQFAHLPAPPWTHGLVLGART